MRFTVDGMLGKVARWLRMLGHDVTYSSNIDDSELLKQAKTGNRVLLTRDFELYQRAIGRGIEAFYVQGRTAEASLAELAKRFKVALEIDMGLSRCPKCNSPVRVISKEEVAGKIEKNTFDHYEEFWECSGCGQVYWQGAHWARIRKTLCRAEEIVEKIEKEN